MKIIRSITPLRLGLAGGGTDIDAYCNKYTGYVLNTTISLYVHCTIEERNDGNIYLESFDFNIKEEIKSSIKLDMNDGLRLYKIIYNRIVKDYVKKPLSFSLYTYSDVPSGSGLGGSSTIVVGIIKVFVEWLNLPLGDYDIAKLAYEIEREDAGISGGAQDQYAATFGGFNFMEFHNNKKVIINPLRIKRWIERELESRIVLYFTNITREAKVLEEHKKIKMQESKSLQALHSIKQDAIDMKEALLKADFKTLASILGRSWESKKTMADIVSNEEIERVYNLAMQSGAYSGKTSGAGAGGFMFFLVEPTNKQNLVNVLNKEQGYVVKFQFVNEGAISWRL